MDMTMLESFNRVSKRFKELTRPFLPIIYISNYLAKELKFGRNPVHICIQTICEMAGHGSGLAIRLEVLFSSRKSWMRAHLTLNSIGYGKFLVEDVAFEDSD